MRLRKRGEKDPLRMCVCVFVDHASPFCKSLLTSHGLKLSHDHIHCKECWEIWSRCSKKIVKWTLVSTSQFPKTTHSGPPTPGEWDGLVIDPRKKIGIPAFPLLLALAWPLHLPFPFHLCVSPFPFTGLSFMLTLISWLLNLALPFLPPINYNYVAAVKF